MDEPLTGNRSEEYGIDEIEVILRIEEGKITAESRSGPKDGSIRLSVDDMTVELTLEGSGSDQATATLSTREFANFRTIVDAIFSAAAMDEGESELDSRTVYSGYQTLRGFDDEAGITLDMDVLREFNLVTESGAVPGGNRQVECTVLGNGTAILNLTGDNEKGLKF